MLVVGFHVTTAHAQLQSTSCFGPYKYLFLELNESEWTKCPLSHVVSCFVVRYLRYCGWRQAHDITSSDEQFIRRSGLSREVFVAYEAKLASMAATAVGHMKPFDPGESIVAYLERIQPYFEANRIKAEKQVPVFFNIISWRTTGCWGTCQRPRNRHRSHSSSLRTSWRDTLSPRRWPLQLVFNFISNSNSLERQSPRFWLKTGRWLFHVILAMH